MKNSLLPVILLLVTLAAPVFAQIPPGIPPGYVQVDDMLLPEAVVYGDAAFVPSYWPLGVVPYTFNANMTATNQGRARDAMAELAAAANVTFIPRTNQLDYVTVQNDTQNLSAIGLIGGQQIVMITNWNERFVIVHELMHALGFIHEQARPDRATFVTINTANIQAGQAGNFAIVNSATGATPYDFNSVMHYGACDFSTDCPAGSTCACSHPTISVNAAYSQFSGAIGNRTFLSLLDAQGLAVHYGAAIQPTATSLSPTTVAAGAFGVTLTVNGSRFCGGSTNANGVPGTVVRWNGSPLSTTYMSPTQVQAWVPDTLLGVPVSAQITVQNPAPGGGVGLGTLPFSVICPVAAPLALAPATPQAVTAACNGFSLPAPTTAWQVVAISSASDWDMSMGSASSTLGGNAADFLAGDGNTSPGQVVTPTTGNFYRYSGQAPATAEFVTSSPITPGSPLITTMPAGSILRAWHFYDGSFGGAVNITINGPSTLRWWLMWGPATFSWRGPFNSLGNDYVGSPTATVSSLPFGTLCLVVCRSGGPAVANEDFTINVCTVAPPATLAAGVSQTITATCQPFSFTPASGKWNAVGVSSTSDWDVGVGTAVSQLGGNNCDYVLANGHNGGIFPSGGVFARYSGTASASGRFVSATTLPAFPGGGSASTTMLALFEFNVVTPGNYDLAVSAPAGYSWNLHLPGASAVWRPRIDAASSGHPADGSVTNVSLAPGWHALAAYHNGGATGAASVTVNAVLTSVPPPILTSMAPASAPAGSATFTLAAYGTGFTATTEIRWNGTGLPTSFVSPTQLSATVDGTLLLAPGAASVTAFIPGSGSSGSLAFTIVNGVPVINLLTPAFASAGAATLTVTVDGLGFVPGGELRWNGIGLPTTFVSATQLTATVDSSYLLVAQVVPVTAFNPPPGGGESAAANFPVLDPVIVSVTPAAIPVQPPAAVPVILTLSGSYLLPSSVVYADGLALPTTYGSSVTLTAVLDPALLPQTAFDGGLVINVQNTEPAVSNSVALVVGSGANVGTIRLQPLAPAANAGFDLRLEGAVPYALLTLVADLGGPVPVPAWPNPVANLVLDVTPLAGSIGPWLPLLDGIGIFAPPDFTAVDVNGALSLPGLVMPPAPLAISVALQAVYLDAGAPLGLRLTWTRILQF